MTEGMGEFTAADFPFIEQIVDAELEARFPGIAAIILRPGHRTDASRRIDALSYLAGAARDEGTMRWIADQALAAGSDGNDVLCTLCRRDDVPMDVLMRCAQCKYFMVCERACSDPRLPEAEIARIVREGRWGQKMGAAKNPSTLAADLAILAGDPDEHVRACVAYNPHTPVASVRTLQADPDSWVREIARNLRGADITEFMAAASRHQREGNWHD